MYVPGFSVTVNVLLPPENTGVFPITEPLLPCWMTMSWGTGDLLVKSIVTLPDLAVSELFVNFSWPVGSADWLTVAPPLLAAGVVVVWVVGVVVVGVVVGVVVVAVVVVADGVVFEPGVVAVAFSGVICPICCWSH